jgi:predicted DNA-binding protein YlxM (UPF0122 family)
MRTNIIDDLRAYYLDQNVKIYKLLGNEKMKRICDAYFKYKLSYRQIAKRFDMTVSEVSNMMITACGLIIRNRYA